MVNILQKSFFKMLLLANIIVGIFYLISRQIDSFAETVGKIGIKVPNHVPFIGGAVIPGDGFKTLVKLLGGPFKMVGGNIKIILIIDVILIVIAFLLHIIRKRQQKAAIEDVAEADTKEEKKFALQKLMKFF